MHQLMVQSTKLLVASQENVPTMNPKRIMTSLSSMLNSKSYTILNRMIVMPLIFHAYTEVSKKSRIIVISDDEEDDNGGQTQTIPAASPNAPQTVKTEEQRPE
ncbi:hypothetical protein E3P98_02193 [Wallemia ichthyophaga]|nr:hypothetical protein E3P98_02193 [Wallemia ichthyophaga]